MAITLGVQALVLDMTCMTLWHNSPVDFYGMAHHHPDSPENHQDADEGHNFVNDVEASLLIENDLPESTLIAGLDDGLIFSPIYTIKILLEFPFLDDGDPPKIAVLV
jgi:hypothetical protein